MLAVSYLAPNWFEFYGAVVSFLGRALQVEVRLVQADRDPLADPLLLEGKLDLAFICGLPFIRHHQSAQARDRASYCAIAAPVMRAARYQNRPIYFSDVIVNPSRGLKSFADLAGKTVCYNDLGSNSGYYMLCDRLRQENLLNRFFGNAIPSGSHQQSIRWVLAGKADCAAIDSTVLEQEQQAFPELARHLRIVESLGPCPMPPIIAADRLGTTKIAQLQRALQQPDAFLRSSMSDRQFCRYEAVETKDYIAIADLYKAVLQSTIQL